MKKLFSILFVFLILLSGMHLSIATHICGGEIAAVKWSFSGEKATCGMENTKTYPVNHGITSNCCHNNIAVYSIDNNYNPTSFQIKESEKNVLLVYYIPVTISFSTSVSANSLHNNSIPPNIALTSDVNLSDICVFRI